MKVLLLGNLPEAIQPYHIRGILGAVPNSKRRRETGIRMIEVYTVPRKQRRPFLGQFKFAKPLPDISTRKESSSASAVSSVSSTPTPSSSNRSSSSPSSSLSEGERMSSRVPFTTPVEDDATTDSELQLSDRTDDAEDFTCFRSRREDSRNSHSAECSPLNELEEQETIAYVHFYEQYHLYRSKELFKRATIDGRRVRVTTKRNAMASFRRAFYNAERAFHLFS